MKNFYLHPITPAAAVLCVGLAVCAAEPAERVVYWSNQEVAAVERASAATGAPESLIVDLPGALGVAVDVDANTVYWADPGAGCIYRSAMSGAPVELFVSGLDAPAGLALDTSTGHLYWTEADRIRGADLPNGGVFTVVTGLNRPSGIAVDEANGYLYWCEQQGGRIQRATTLGQGLEAVVTGLQKPTGIAYAASKIYWCDAGTGKVQSAEISVKAPTTLISGVTAPTEIEADAPYNALFWTDGTGVQTAALDGGALASFATSPDRLGGVAVAHMPETTPAGREPEVWVDFNAGTVQTGTYLLPFYTIPNAFNKVAEGGTVKVVAGTSNDTGLLDFDCRIDAWMGTVRLGGN